MKPITIPDPTTVEGVELWKARKLSADLLGADLVPSDSHDEDGAMMTSDQAWFFVPLKDDPVMLGRGIAHGTIPSDRPKWAVETVHCVSSYSEPDDYELSEDGNRQDSLFLAVAEASRLLHEATIRNTGESIYWEGENRKDRICPPKDDMPQDMACPHGNSTGDCDACDRLSDFAFDAAREDRIR
jgi:hypothetical protein